MKERKHSSNIACVIRRSTETSRSRHPIGKQVSRRYQRCSEICGSNGSSRCVTQECGLPSHEIGPIVYFYHAIPSTDLILAQTHHARSPEELSSNILLQLVQHASLPKGLRSCFAGYCLQGFSLHGLARRQVHHQRHWHEAF
jgi:hypothetical protein